MKKKFYLIDKQNVLFLDVCHVTLSLSSLANE